MKKKIKGVKCSFCEKDSKELGILIYGGSGANICDRCIIKCCETLFERAAEAIKKEKGDSDGK